MNELIAGQIIVTDMGSKKKSNGQEWDSFGGMYLQAKANLAFEVYRNKL